MQIDFLLKMLVYGWPLFGLRCDRLILTGQCCNHTPRAEILQLLHLEQPNMPKYPHLPIFACFCGFETFRRLEAFRLLYRFFNYFYFFLFFWHKLINNTTILGNEVDKEYILPLKRQVFLNCQCPCGRAGEKNLL